MIINGVRLSADDWVRLKNAAAIAQAIENRWDAKVRKAIATAAEKSAEQVSSGGEIDVPDFEDLFVRHYFDTVISALKIAEKETELDKKAPRLARRPRSLKDIMALYDAWRKGKYKPRGPLQRAKEIKKQYLDAVQKSWKKYSHDFREGGEETQAEIKEKIKKAAETTTSRAQTIVRTETTTYYNRTRREYYDTAQDVTHYLFVALRDKATTPWCSPNKTNGKRGRSGLVYAKTDPLLDKETPPVHWNCRSELLPLNKFNPSHKKLIENPSIQRRAHECTPLPPEWAK